MGDRGTPRRGVFGPADERPYRRLVGDWIRLVLAGALDGFFATLLISDGYL